MARKKEGRRDNKSGQIVEDGKYFRARVEVGRDARTGRPRYKTARCKTRTEAVEALDRLLADRRAGIGEQTERGNFGQFLDRWLEHAIKATRAVNTYRQYEWLVRDHIKPHLGNKQTDKITRVDVQRLLSVKATQALSPRDKEQARKRESTLSGNTLRLIRAVLHTAFEEAKRSSLTMRNPASGVELPRKSRREIKQFLTSKEAEGLVKALDKSDLADLFAFLIATGTRISEATGVRWQDIDLSTPGREIVWIRGQLQRVGKSLVYVSGTKTHQERCLPLTKSIVQRLTTVRAKRLMGEVTDSDGIVFLNAEGRRIDRKHANNRLEDLCKEAKIDRISVHKLRHTAATLMLAESGDLHAVQKALGHAQVALTADLYGHATAETLRPVMSKLDRILETP